MARKSKPTVLATKAIPSLGVSDIDRSVAFYRQFFGFRIIDSYEMEGHMAWCWMRVGDADLMLQQLSADQQITLNPAIGQSWVLYIRPNDLGDLHARLTEAGFPVTAISQDLIWGERMSSCPTPTATSCGSRFPRLTAMTMTTRKTTPATRNGRRRGLRRRG